MPVRRRVHHALYNVKNPLEKRGLRCRPIDFNNHLRRDFCGRIILGKIFRQKNRRDHCSPLYKGKRRAVVNQKIG